MSSKPVVSVRIYVFVFFTLLVFTAVTTSIAFFDLGGGLNDSAAVTNAISKTLLVILYFMHVRYSDKLTWVFAAAGFFWLLILMGGTMDDVLTRQWISPATENVSTEFHPK